MYLTNYPLVHKLDAGSIGQLQETFDAYRNDESAMKLLKNQMGKLALDVQLMQDQQLNEARNEAHGRLRLRQRKAT